MQLKVKKATTWWCTSIIRAIAQAKLTLSQEYTKQEG
jgi:hypothetical protein